MTGSFADPRGPLGARRVAALLAVIAAGTFALECAVADEPRGELIFPPRRDHNHAPGVAECPSGDLIVSWYRGSGERKADDVAVLGARRRRGEREWSEPFTLADTPGFPDGNTALHVDARGRLWLFWPVVIANTWESCQTLYRVSEDYEGDGPPVWSWQGTMYLVPRDFASRMREGLEERAALGALPEEFEEIGRDRILEMVDDKLASRLGWQTRCKPTVLPSGRTVLPLYSDTYSAGLMALSDDGGRTWRASEPLPAYGGIQPSVLRRDDGTLVAYMRENGPLGKVRVAESKDDGETWGPVGVTDLPNPGSGLDAVRLRDGRWLMVLNDTTEGRGRLAVSLSADEGRTWSVTRHLEDDASGSFHYPAVIESRDGLVHVVYSHFTAAGKTMKHVEFAPAWVAARE